MICVSEVWVPCSVLSKSNTELEQQEEVGDVEASKLKHGNGIIKRIICMWVAQYKKQTHHYYVMLHTHMDRICRYHLNDKTISIIKINK